MRTQSETTSRKQRETHDSTLVHKPDVAIQQLHILYIQLITCASCQQWRVRAEEYFSIKKLSLLHLPSALLYDSEGEGWERGRNPVSPIYNIISLTHCVAVQLLETKTRHKTWKKTFGRYCVPHIGCLLYVHVVVLSNYLPESHLLYGNCWWMVTHIQYFYIGRNFIGHFAN